MAKKRSQDIFAPARGFKKKSISKRTSKHLKEALLEAAERVGSDTNGKDGLVGYCMFLAVHHPKVFGPMLIRVMPLQVTGADGGPIRIVDETMSVQEAAEAYSETLRAIPGLASVTQEIELYDDEFQEVD
jgi:hypothetical protein